MKRASKVKGESSAQQGSKKGTGEPESSGFKAHSVTGFPADGQSLQEPEITERIEELLGFTLGHLEVRCCVFARHGLFIEYPYEEIFDR